jgi:hypothetical protein
LNSVKNYLSSVAEKLVNSVTLNLGYLANIGVNKVNNTLNKLKFVVTYSISPDAPITESAKINFNAQVGRKSFSNQSLDFEQTILFVNSTQINQVCRYLISF